MKSPESAGRIEGGIENPERKFSRLLDKYHQLHERIKMMERGRTGLADETTQERLFRLDEMRNSIHKELKEVGAKLGKSERDVLVDIIREQKTLETYGLPEFSILTENDITLRNDWHNPYFFNVSGNSPGPSIQPTSKLTDAVGQDPEALPGSESEDYYEDDYYAAKPIMKPDECMLVFAIVPVVNYGEEELDPVDYDVLSRRAENLATKVHGELFHTRDSSYHEAYAKILGVVIKKRDLEDVAKLIRENPTEYRLQEEFYSADDLKLLEERRKWEDQKYGEAGYWRELDKDDENTEDEEKDTPISKN